MEVELADRRFLVFGHLVRTDEKGAHSFLATTYWVDVRTTPPCGKNFMAPARVRHPHGGQL